MKVKALLGMSPIKEILKTELIKNVSIVKVDEINHHKEYRVIPYDMTDDVATLIDGNRLFRDVLNNGNIEINPDYIVTVRQINVTKVIFEHENSNYPTKKMMKIFEHDIGTEVEFINVGGYTTPSNINLKEIVKYDL